MSQLNDSYVEEKTSTWTSDFCCPVIISPTDSDQANEDNNLLKPGSCLPRTVLRLRRREKNKVVNKVYVDTARACHCQLKSLIIQSEYSSFKLMKIQPISSPQTSKTACKQRVKPTWQSNRGLNQDWWEDPKNWILAHTKVIIDNFKYNLYSLAVCHSSYV